MNGKRFVALLIAALLCLSPLSAFADEYDIDIGSITVTANDGGQTVTHEKASGTITQDDAEPVIKGNSTDNTVTIHAEEGYTAHVTFSEVNINIPSNSQEAAVTTNGAGNVTIELDGTNELTGGDNHAGLQKENGGTLTIQDDNDTEGSLKAQGGSSGAGIGGGQYGDGSDITITGGTITAKGGDFSAGIGGGYEGDGSDITITGGSINANGGGGGAGIGGGYDGDGSDITITGATITSNGGYNGAGIGGGADGAGISITITDSDVTAVGGNSAAGIGGGPRGNGSGITITDSTVTANGGDFGAGIGGCVSCNGSGITITDSDVTAVGGVNGAGIGAGGGSNGAANNITIIGDSEVSVAGGQQSSSYPAGPGIGYPGGSGGESSEIEPDIDNLSCSSGTVNYYEPGTSVEAIQNGSATPINTVTGKGHNPGDPVKENEVAPQPGVEGSYDLVTYCKYCGTELERETVTVPALEPDSGSGSEQEEDAFTRFCKNVAKQVREASENGTVEVDATPWPGFQHRVFEALADRPDVTLIVTINLNGEEGKLTIPAGIDLLSSIGNAKVTTFEDLGKLLG